MVHDLLYRPEHSLVLQSYCSREQKDCLNADGCGVGWYAPEISQLPAVFRSPLPAWSNLNLKSISTLLSSGRIFAHVRAASSGLGISEANCHPFSSGPLLWMHNGTLAGFAELRDWARRFLSREAFSQIHGSTDSEHIFALFLEEWNQAGGPREPDGLAAVFRKTLSLLTDILRDSGIREHSHLNFALTDGQTTIACRHSLDLAGELPRTLYVARDVHLRLDSDACRFERSKGPADVLIASEPLFADTAWEPVPPHRMLVVRPDGSTSLHPLD
ncbi:MAG TPA: class II glutamine amidotransferase [Planctomycetota bacterium]|nr:class II glutamine amidotransferase [Planctomycetota bacterium]